MAAVRVVCRGRCDRWCRRHRGFVRSNFAFATASPPDHSVCRRCSVPSCLFVRRRVEQALTDHRCECGVTASASAGRWTGCAALVRSSRAPAPVVQTISQYVGCSPIRFSAPDANRPCVQATRIERGPTSRTGPGVRARWLPWRISSSSTRRPAGDVTDDGADDDAVIRVPLFGAGPPPGADQPGDAAASLALPKVPGDDGGAGEVRTAGNARRVRAGRADVDRAPRRSRAPGAECGSWPGRGRARRHQQVGDQPAAQRDAGRPSCRSGGRSSAA